jgi:hypothetical protein
LSSQSLLSKEIKFSKQELGILILIIIFASVLRLWDLGSTGFNNDEAIYSGQAATLAGHKESQQYFSIYRAHPLLLQFMISILFSNFGINDTIARIIPAVLGIFTIIVTYLIGKLLYNTKIATVASIVIAILPYHIVISRQVLLDVSLSFFYTLLLFSIARHFRRPNDVIWLYSIGICSGLSFLSKEVGIFALIASIICIILIKSFSLKNLIIIVASFLLASSPYWIPILTIQEAHDAALAYWHWQTSRDPNQPDSFYFTLISREALGFILTGLFILSVIYAFISKTIKKPEVFILLIWVAIPIILFQFLAVKGYAFLAPVVPPFVLLGVSFLFSEWMQKIPYHRIIIIVLIPLIFIFSGPMLHNFLDIRATHLVGSGGEPYSREGALWIRDNIGDKGVFLTLDTRTANVIKYYSNNNALALHSNNNPAYTRVNNPDLLILNHKIDYLVYEVYLAEQLRYLKDEAKELSQLVTKYNAIPIHIEYETYVDNHGKKLMKPGLIIYSLNPNKED